MARPPAASTAAAARGVPAASTAAPTGARGLPIGETDQRLAAAPVRAVARPSFAGGSRPGVPDPVRVARGRALWVGAGLVLVGLVLAIVGVERHRRDARVAERARVLDPIAEAGLDARPLEPFEIIPYVPPRGPQPADAYVLMPEDHGMIGWTVWCGADREVFARGALDGGVRRFVVPSVPPGRRCKLTFPGSPSEGETISAGETLTCSKRAANLLQCRSSGR